MVTVIKTKVNQNKEGKSFVSIKLQGDPELVQSLDTGKFYMTAHSCYVTTTFDETIANSLIGKQLPGNIERVASEPYQYTIESTGEVISLSHRYEYKPTSVPEKDIHSSTSEVADHFEELEA